MTAVRSTPPTSSGSSGWSRLAVLAILVGIFVWVAIQYRHELSLAKLAAREAQLRQTISTQPVAAYVAAFLIYAVATGLSIPGATVLTLAYGWLFRFWPAVVLVSFASTTGATIACLLSRYLFRDAVQTRFGDRLSQINQALEREGAFYLFTLRLIPQIPFFVINVVMGLTPLQIRTFWWVSQVGMLPATVVYVYAGASVQDLQTLAASGGRGILSPQLMAALICLGIFPIAVKKLLHWWGTPKPGAADATHTS